MATEQARARAPSDVPVATRAMRPSGPRGWLTRITHLGVDPALPRHQTKHIVLANQYAIFVTVCFGVSLLGAESNALLAEARMLLAAGLLACPLTLLLNAWRLPTAASAWLIASFAAVMFAVGRLEPLETEHVSFLILDAAIAWFLFPPAKGWWRPAFSVGCGALGAVLYWSLVRWPPPAQSPGFDAVSIGFGNLATCWLAFVFYCARTAHEMARVERELVEERDKTESLLKREVAHQVAERSRELGAALARTEGPITPASAARFGERYQVIRPLGEGGMGAVFEVERKTDGQRLALKVMTSSLSREHAARFAREAEIGARVHHPNVVSIVDVGIAEGGAPFLVMELVTGGALEARRARFGDLAFVLPILRDVLAGLAALHQAGVVHRDLKPANVLLDERGAAKVSDFGIARLAALTTAIDPSAPTEAASGSARALTATGAWIGTPHYMAPEAAHGAREALASADLFAFGLIAYELVTGRHAFSTPAVLLALADQPLPEVPPLDVPGLPRAVAEVILACLAQDPNLRPDARRALSALD